MKKFVVSEDKEIILSGKKYLLEKGDKIVLNEENYFNIGHKNDSILWAWDNGKLKFSKDENFHDNYVSGKFYTGRIDKNDKKISMSSPIRYGDSPSDEKIMNRIVNQLSNKYPNYEIWFQNNNGQNPMVRIN